MEFHYFFLPLQIIHILTSILCRYANSKELTFVFFSLFFSPFLRILRHLFLVFRSPSDRRTLPLFVPKAYLFSRSFSRSDSSCIVMNHNFKLKPSETFVTNDAEPFNYALKSTRENVDKGNRRRRVTYHHVASRWPASCYPMPTMSDNLLSPRSSLSFPIFNARGACREFVGELSRTSPSERGYRSNINQPFVCERAVLFVNTLKSF